MENELAPGKLYTSTRSSNKGRATTLLIRLSLVLTPGQVSSFLERVVSLDLSAREEAPVLPDLFLPSGGKKKIGRRKIEKQAQKLELSTVDYLVSAVDSILYHCVHSVSNMRQKKGPGRKYWRLNESGDVEKASRWANEWDNEHDDACQSHSPRPTKRHKPLDGSRS